MASPAHGLAIIGGGAAGLMAAQFAASFGVRVVLVDRQRLGGDCLWTGCVPSKTLLRAAHVADAMRHAARYGLTATEPVIRPTTSLPSTSTMFESTDSPAARCLTRVVESRSVCPVATTSDHTAGGDLPQLMWGQWVRSCVSSRARRCRPGKTAAGCTLPG